MMIIRIMFYIFCINVCVLTALIYIVTANKISQYSFKFMSPTSNLKTQTNLE